jgi:hypothetical protein
MHLRFSESFPGPHHQYLIAPTRSQLNRLGLSDALLAKYRARRWPTESPYRNSGNSVALRTLITHWNREKSNLLRHWRRTGPGGPTGLQNAFVRFSCVM